MSQESTTGVSGQLLGPSRHLSLLSTLATAGVGREVGRSTKGAPPRACVCGTSRVARRQGREGRQRLQRPFAEAAEAAEAEAALLLRQYRSCYGYCCCRSRSRCCDCCCPCPQQLLRPPPLLLLLLLRPMLQRQREM